MLLSRMSCCPQSAWEEAERALTEELRLLDIPVTVVQGDAEISADLPNALAIEAQREEAEAAVSVLKTGGASPRVEVWIYDRVADRTLVKSWTLENPDDPDAAMTAGIRGVEALRASLLETEMPKSPLPAVERAPSPSSNSDSGSEKAATPSETRSEAASPTLISGEIKRVAVGAGPSLLASFQGIGVRGGFDISFDWQPLRFLALHFDTAYWPVGKDIEKNDAVTAVKLFLIRGGLTFMISDRGVVRPSLSIQGGGFMCFAEGLKALGNRISVSDTTNVGYVGGAFDTAFRVARWFYLRLNVGVGVTLPEVVLHHGDVIAASLGRPLLDASLRVEFRLP